jgi:hypothetical protein
MKKRLISVGLLLLPSIAVAGPPYLTDDPVPTDTRHWEIYAFAAGTQTPGNFDGNAGLDLNYGPIENVQLTATLPVSFTRGGANRSGIGDIEIGAKYRFFHKADKGIAIAIFPRLILPTANNGFGSGKVGVLLPVWAQKDIGPWSVFGGGGYSLNPGAGNRDYWQASAAVTRQLSKRLSLGIEIAHRGPDSVGGRSYTALNAGGVYKLGGPFSLLVSGGPGIQNARDGGRLNAYAGLAINF